MAQRWHTVAARAPGSGHLRIGRPCEDAFHSRTTADGALVAAVADGLGSARCAAHGSHLATQGAVAAIQRALMLGDASTPGPTLVRAAFTEARAALERSAASVGMPGSTSEGASLRDLATTLIVVLVRGGEITVGHLGDGVVIVRRGGELEPLSLSRTEAYANLVASLTADDWMANVRVTHTGADGVDGVLLTTDGLEHVVLFNQREGVVNQALVPKLLHLADRDDLAPDVKHTELEAWLQSDMVRARTDDDVTLVLAVAR